MDLLYLFLIVILIGLTGFFVAAEFAIVKVRMSRIDQLVQVGNKKAIAAKKVVSNLDEYLSSCQLGITITALALGWVGEPTVERLLHPVFEHFDMPTSVSRIVSFAIAFGTITYLHVVIGELAPKTLAIQKAEKLTLLLATPLIWFYRIMYPFIWLLNGSARVVIKLFGLHPASEHEMAHSEEELRIILSESYQSGEINQSEYKYVDNIFEFDNRIAREIMIPRTEIVSFDVSLSIQDFLREVKDERYTRYPVIDGDKDHIIGLINLKSMIKAYFDVKDIDTTTIKDFVTPIIYVIETIPIHDLLKKMQKDQIHMAILIDEYGGTSGLVTVEDILEEIVGEIRDEFDVDETPDVQNIKDNHYILDGKVLISEVNKLLNLSIDDEDIDTIGGWILTKEIDVQENQIIEYEGYIFTLKEIDDHQIKLIEISPR
ncbi:hemolysin family protein [Cytobacillus sp. IB215665]|uniref:hemolysin family protein n=1 Tax=Cytobacillus sp. IB215665 TaxID=3097357 RepID=UPI002A0F3144|nr:hemolysin family protein [Cytobacillus sp. IB215665]MDX8365590.1 hemolysin family protein [Cytobacillus sp. IB215665]